LTAPRLAALAALDDAAFRKMFAGTAIKRTGRNRFVRNVLIAIGNAAAGDPQLIVAARSRLDDASALVRAAAVWAFARLAPAAEYEAERTRRLPEEADPLVREEWQRCAG
jgi:epoxyqueuosine reductase